MSFPVAFASPPMGLIEIPAVAAVPNKLFGAFAGDIHVAWTERHNDANGSYGIARAAVLSCNEP